MSELSRRLLTNCGNDGCEPCIKCSETMRQSADELDRLLAIESEYNRCRERVAEIASRESEQHAEQRREIDRLRAIVDQLIHAGNAMPRKTLFAGGSGDEFQYTIVSGAIWDFDKAMTAAEKARTA